MQVQIIKFDLNYFLTGNIRVYCRIRPFLPEQREKQTIVDYIGEDGELVIANTSKPGKDSRRLFKFNKVFGLAATQGYYHSLLTLDTPFFLHYVIYKHCLID